MYNFTGELEGQTKENEDVQQLKRQLEEQKLKNSMLEKKLYEYKKKQTRVATYKTESEFNPTNFEDINSLSVPAWEQDYSKVYKRMVELNQQGITNLHDYFDQHPKEFFALIKQVQVTRCNHAADKLLNNRKISTLFDLFHPSGYKCIIETLETIQRHEKELITELPVIKSNGESVYCLMKWISHENHLKSYSNVHISLFDISDRYQVENQLRETNRRLSTLLGNLHGIVYQCCLDTHYTMLFLSKMVYSITGYQAGELLMNRDLAFINLIVPEDLPSIQKQLEQAVLNKERFTLEYRIKTKSGEEKWVWEQGIGIPNQDGVIDTLEGFMVDITDRKKAQLKLQNEQLHLQTVFETIPDLIWLKDPQGTYLNCNYQFEQFIGAKEEDIIGKTDYDFENKTQADWFNKNDLAAIQANQSNTNLEWVTFASDGHQALLETVKTPMFDSNGELVGVLGIARDVTKSKQNEKELKERKNWYKTIFNNTGTATCILNEKHEIVQMNDIFKKLSGFTQFDLDNKIQWMDFVSPQDLPRMIQYDKERRSPGENPPRQYDCTLISKQGTHHHVVISIDMIPGTTMSVASLLDITLRTKALQELKQSQEKYQNLVESINDIIYELDDAWNFSYISPSVEAITGYSPDFYLGKHFMSVVSPSDVSRMRKEFDQFLNSPDSTPFEFQPNTKNNQTVWLRISVHPKVNRGAISGLRGIASDITKQKAIEAELIQAKEKAEQANELKSAFLSIISHELRTPLNAIIGFSQLMDDSISKKDLLDMSKIIFDSGNHLLSLIESILNLTMLQSKQARIKAETFCFDDLLKNLRFFLEGELQKNGNKKLCTIFPLPDTNHKIELYTDKTKLIQLLSNLLSNAVKYSDEGVIEFSYRLKGSTITFAVKDEGIGIPLDMQELIFERFRQVDNSNTRKYSGVGLGLAICKEIAGLLNGNVWVESVEGKGSTFYFELPQAAKTRKIN
ncbi:PAS domain-containing sensor histidine kinase [Sunxiuqinia rutila]|uniref:PAS domain-containing sensor histidine kinase n=1 Tax=Sunxiuqinia rutila TaxID=1397841 RepID=UPI003D35D4BD